MATAVEQIKERLNIVDVVSSYLKLEKSGTNFRARCPFHNERTPSFFVSPTRQSFHCFGCNRGGDMFTFVQDIEGLDFVGTLKILAERAGIELVSLPRGESEGQARLYEVLAAASRFFQARLKDQPAVLAYLQQRGLNEETRERFQLGWAESGWRSLTEALLLKNFSIKDLVAAGLVISKDTRYYDRFRSRIMFPLVDGAGRVVGFSGRIFSPDGAPVPETTGKYINTPETKLYNKSKILYGYYQAKTEIRRQDLAVIVEGQMDLLLAHQSGTTNAVAVSGTALTAHHLELIKRLSRNIIMAFDGDSAGINASRRAVGLALQIGLEVKIAELPTGLDPADWILKDQSSWQQALKQARHAIDFYLAVLERQSLPRREFSHAVKQDIYPFLLQLTERIDRSHFIAELAGRLGLAEAVIEADLEDLRHKQNPLLATSPAVEPTTASAPESVSRLELIEGQLLGLYWWLLEHQAAARSWTSEVVAVFGEVGWSEREHFWQDKKSTLLFEAERTFADRPLDQLQAAWAELIGNWRQEKTRLAFKEATAALAIAEASGDQAAIDAALRHCQTLSQEINNFVIMQ